MASILAIGANDSSKSIPSIWAYPLHTSLALFRVICTFSSSLFLKIHLVPITFLSFGLGTSSQVSFFSIWLSSSYIALIQHLSLLASSTSFGSAIDSRDKYTCSGVCTYFLLLVSTPVLPSPIICSRGWFFLYLSVGHFQGHLMYLFITSFFRFLLILLLFFLVFLFLFFLNYFSFILFIRVFLYVWWSDWFINFYINSFYYLAQS